MGRRVLSCCLLLVLTLPAASAVDKLHDIGDLMNVDFGHAQPPRHGMMLLRWLSTSIYIDNNNNMYLICDPNRGDYGFHRYHNGESLLPPLRHGHRYYTVGNINTNIHFYARQLPSSVTQHYHPTDEGSNMDRIIVRGTEERFRYSYRNRYGYGYGYRFRVYAVYITQHDAVYFTPYYDPDNTFLLSLNLLRQMRDWQPTINECQLPREPRLRERNRGVRDAEIVDCPQVKLEVKTSRKGQAIVSWSGIPKELQDLYVVLALFKDHNSHGIYDSITSATVIGMNAGRWDTSVPLNPGLQVRLHKIKYNTIGDEVWRGPEFDDANREIPANIQGYDASLQLFVKDGKACARLFILKSFTDWKNEFSNSWVGFYSSDNKGMGNYAANQYATEFSKESSSDLIDLPEYDVYMYESDMAIFPGVHARFMLEKQKGEKVRTPPWDLCLKLEVKTTSNGKARLCWRDISKELLDQGVMVVLFQDNDSESKLSSVVLVSGLASGCYGTWDPLNPGLQVRLHKENTHWFWWSTIGDEIWRGPEFDDANREIPVYIEGYSASLQLFVKDGKACARLFIKTSFTDWKNEFSNSWVGFYSSDNEDMNNYATYQYAVKFWKGSRSDQERIPDYDVYMYKSNMALYPGVQVRFMLEKTGPEMARTPSWERQNPQASLERSC